MQNKKMMRRHTELLKKFISGKISDLDIIDEMNKEVNVDIDVDYPLRTVIYASQDKLKKEFEDKKEVIEENIWACNNNIAELKEQGEFTATEENERKKFDRQLGRLSDTYYNYLALTKEALEISCMV